MTEPPPAAQPASTSDQRSELITSLLEYLGHLGAAATSNGRPDLARRIRLATGRLQRPETVVVVAGEFKQGKSSLINALMGVAACPVDDDLATAAVTVVGNGPALAITVRRREGKAVVAQAITADELPGFVTERGNPENSRAVESVEIRLPNGLLAKGLTFIDTPGIGALNPAQAAAALAFLPVADALVLVSDASAELTRPELDFLARARTVCPLVLVVLSKTDLYPAWRRIDAADGEHLRQSGLVTTAIPVSSALRAEALRRADAAINVESGFPTLLERLQDEVLDGARDRAATQSLAEGRQVLRHIFLPLHDELAGLRDPEALVALQSDLKIARERVQSLRAPASRWAQRLNDGFADLSAAADYQFRGAMRGLVRQAEDEIDKTNPVETWDRLSTQLQADVTSAVGQTFSQLVTGAEAIREDLAALIDDQEILAGSQAPQGFDVTELWSRKPIGGSGVRAGLGAGFGALRGAQSGVIMLGMLGNLFGLTMVGLPLMGVAVLFAGKSAFDERKRQLVQRRQEARVAIRQYADDVQFEVGTRVRDMLRELLRQIREDVSHRLDELNRTYTEAASALEQTLKRDSAAREQRAAQVDDELRALRDLDGRLGRLESRLAAGIRTPGPEVSATP